MNEVTKLDIQRVAELTEAFRDMTKAYERLSRQFEEVARTFNNSIVIVNKRPFWDWRR